MIANILKKMFRKIQYRHEDNFSQTVISLYSSHKNSKTVLLSYLIDSFVLKQDNPIFYSHSNFWECQQIANTWVKHGYNVDIIHWSDSIFLPKKEYDVFIDIHSNMERLAPLLKKDCLKILHITGAHWLFQNRAEYNRLCALKERRNVTLIPRRIVQPSMAIEYADVATILGNEFTKSTFAYSKKPIYSIPISTTIEFPFFEGKNFFSTRKCFLWFGASGMVHKGLDLVLEAFSRIPDYTLIVCGPVKDESDFEKAYFKELYETPNIQTLGRVDVRSNQFKDVLNKCIGLVYPSCSEGGGGSVITCLHGGLIPILSTESSINVHDFGILLEENSIDEILKSVQTVSNFSRETLKEMSRRAWEYAKKNHTQKTFAEAYTNFVKEIITIRPES